MKNTTFFSAFILVALLCLSSNAADQQAGVEAAFRRMSLVLAEQAREILDRAKEEEKADTALVLGTIFEMGMADAPDPITASEFYVIASDLGSAEANCAMGNFYLSGVQTPEGRIPQNVDIALDYYGRAVVGGNIKAMMLLADIYRDGTHGQPRDSKKELIYLMDAASRGDNDAINRLNPVMEKAKAWEESHPGKKANFPTTLEELVKMELVQKDALHNRNLERRFAAVYSDLNKRTAAKLSDGQKNPTYQ